MRARQTAEETVALAGDSMPETSTIRREIAGALILLVGLFILVCLLTGGGESLVGPVGNAVGSGLLFFFGHITSYLVPAGLGLLGVTTFLGKEAARPGLRPLGISLLILAINGLLALPGADVPELRTETFARAGALGTFLVEWEGLRLVGQFGTVGAALILCGILLVGMVLTTGLGLSAIAALALRRPLPAAAMVVVEDEEAEEDAAPPPVAAKARAPRAPEPPIPPRDPWWKRVFARRRKAEAGERSRILTDLKDAEGWTEPADADVAAAARALEEHEWRESAERSLRFRLGKARAAAIQEVEEEAGETAAEEDEQDLFDATGKESLEDEEEDDGEDMEIGGDGGDGQEDTEIIFKDNSGPLPIVQGNPGNAKNAAMGEGLAKLFPSRWPKEGVPAGAVKETPGELIDKAEARRFRQLAEDGDAAGAHEDDPLFREEIDTKPFGPNGEPLAVGAKPPVVESAAYDVSEYELPGIEMLADPPVVDARMTREEVLETSDTLVQTLAHFDVEGKVTEVHQGPVVTRFEFKPAAGIKVSRITGLENDIAMGMKAVSVRILAPIPGKAVVGIEVPNSKRQGVYLKELICCEEFWNNAPPLLVALGKTIDGSPHFADLAKMPHLLIAGATGAGKSVCLNTVICSLLYRNTPDKVKLILVDPKRVELSIYGDIPHLIAPVVCDAKRAATALDWAVEQMESRYKMLVELGVRNIDSYNKIVENPEGHRKARGRKLEHMPYLVIIVDELADLMLVAKAEVEESIQRLAQMARAVGIHLILATQRPSVNVITGIIKANFPSRIAFQVSQKVDSRTILDCNGAEALLGRGDMLFSGGGARKPIRIQGCFLSDEEVEMIADHCRAMLPVQYVVEEFEPKLSEKEQRELAKMMGASDFDDLEAQDHMMRGTNRVMGKVTAGMFIPHDGGSARAGDDEIDEALVRAAARLVMETRSASVSMIQRRLKVGFARAGRLMDMLHEMGLVGEFKGSKPRDILVDPEAALEELDKLERALAAGRSADSIRAGASTEEDGYEEEVEHEEEDER